MNLPVVVSSERQATSMELLEQARQAVCEVLGPTADAEQQHDMTITKTDAGMNNWVYYATLPATSSLEAVTYVVRLYNNGGNEAQVRAEHQVLRALRQRQEALGFLVPTALLRHDAAPGADDGPYCRLGSGLLASVFQLMPGCSPAGHLRYIRSMGRAAGGLADALWELYAESAGKIATPSLPMYHEVWHVHHAITKERFFSFLADPAHAAELQPWRPELHALVRDLADMEELLRTLTLPLASSADNATAPATQLPMSFVHGDLVTDNFMVDPHSEGVTGVLDFEFVGADWRAMELAVCTSKFPEENDPLAFFSAFFEGYQTAEGQVHKAPFTEQEIALFPRLITLRILSNVVFFVGRVLSRELPLARLTERIPGYHRRRVWLDHNSRELIALLRKYNI